MSRHLGMIRVRSFAAFSAWLLLASLLFTIVASPSPAAGGFQVGGQPASLVLGQANFTSNVYSLDPTSLYRPFRPAFDSSGNLWVADKGNHRVLEFKPPFMNGEAASIELGQPNFGSNLTTPSQNVIPSPVAVAFDRSGDLWVADSNDNRTLEFVPPFQNGMNAALEIGQPPGANQFTSSLASSAAAGLHSPVALAFDMAGDLWIVDRLNNRVLEFGPPFVSGEAASRVIGQSNLTSRDPSVTQSGLFQPESAAFDSSGSLWVVDEGNNRVLEFAASSLGSNGPSAALEIGHAPGPDEFLTRNAGATPGTLNAPVGVAFGPSGDVLVSDRVNNRVLGFEPPFADGMNATFEIGQPAGPDQFTSPSPGLARDRLHNPLGMTFDASGNLWVADELNGRVLEFSGAAATSMTTATQAKSGGGSSPAPILNFVAGVVLLALAGGGVIAYAKLRKRRADRKSPP